MTTIRDAVPADLPRLQQVFEQASLSNDGDREVLLEHPEVLELDDAGIRAGRTRVAEVDGLVTGFATIVVDGPVAEVEDLFVDPVWMRQGVATALMADLVARARAEGCTRVEVTGNEHALAFYGSVGFVVVGVASTPLRPAPRLRLDL